MPLGYGSPILKSILQAAGDLIYGSGANSPAKLALGTKGHALIAGASAPVYEPHARRTRLINGAMRVQQRLTMPTADDSYCLDQWILLLEAANAATVAQEVSDVPTDGSKRALRLTVGSGEDNKFGVVNILEFMECSDLRGKTVSLQLKLKSTAGLADVRAAVIEWTGAADTVTSDVVATWGSAGTNPTLATSWAYCSGYTPVSLAPTTSWATYKIEGVSVGASANNLAVLIWCDDETTTVTTDVLRITDVQLEEGSICTQIDRVPLAVDVARCQRYFQLYGADSSGGSSLALATGYAFGTTLGLFAFKFTCPMRTYPTGAVSAAADFGLPPSGSAPSSVGFTVSREAARIEATTTGLTAGMALNLQTGTGTAFLSLSAEL